MKCQKKNREKHLTTNEVDGQQGSERKGEKKRENRKQLFGEREGENKKRERKMKE